MRRIVPALLLSLLLCRTSLVRAQEAAVPSTQPATRPAVLQLLIPADATATVDDKELDSQHSITVSDFEPGQTRRVAVKVKFPGGAEEEREVDLEEGQTIPLPVPTPQPDKAVATPMEKVDPVLAVALSPDGRLLAIGLDSNAIVFWDLNLGRPPKTLLRHRALVQSLAFSADGKQLLSGSGDNTAMLWDLATGLPVQTFKGHTDQVMSVAFSPDGKRILTGSMDKTAIVWDAATAQKLLTISGHKDQVFGIAWSPDGKIVATASLDKTGALWDAETGQQLFNLRGHPDGVSCVTFSPDGKTVATGSFDNSAIFWDVATGKKLKQTGKHEIDIYGVTYTPDGRKLLTSARDEVVMMWDAATGRKLRTFLGHNSDVGGAVVSADSRLMFSCSRDGMVKLWDMASGMELASLITDASRKSWAVVAPDGLFDASEPGRSAMGFRFAKRAGGSLDQFFNERFHPGLLSELCEGRRPMSAKPLGHTLPPTVKIISPKTRSTAGQSTISVTVQTTDQGGGISELQLFNDGTPIAVKRGFPTTGPSKSMDVVFDNVPLAPGANQLRAIASNSDGSWQSAPSDIEVNYPQNLRIKGRLYIVAIGDSQPLAEMMRARAARLYDRVDVIAVAHRDATRERISDTLADVAALTKPRDSVIVVLRSPGSIDADKLVCIPTAGQNLTVDELVAALGKSAALQRAMILDLNAISAGQNASPSVLRGALERLARSEKIDMVASLNSTGAKPASLSEALLATAPGSSEMMEWFRAAADKSGGQCSTQSAGFAIFSPEKP